MAPREDDDDPLRAWEAMLASKALLIDGDAGRLAAGASRLRAAAAAAIARGVRRGSAAESGGGGRRWVGHTSHRVAANRVARARHPRLPTARSFAGGRQGGLSSQKTTKYRAEAALFKYVAAGRPDLAYALKETTLVMARPEHQDFISSSGCQIYARPRAQYDCTSVPMHGHAIGDHGTEPHRLGRM